MKGLKPEDLENLRSLLLDERWKAVNRALESWLEENKQVCCLVKEDHRFYQGRVSMIIELMRCFESAKKPEMELFEASAGAHTTLPPRGFRRVAGSY